MIRLSLAFILCFTLAVQAQTQDIQTLRLIGFTGLNTIDIFPKPAEAVIAHNVDLSRSKVGAPAKRYGFNKIDSLTTIDSINFMAGIQWDDGSKYMLVVGADPDSGWGRVYISNQGSTELEVDSLTEIYTRYPISGDLSLSKLRDRYYLTNSTGRGVVISRISSDTTGFSVRPFPMLAPGEPLIVPIAAETDTTTYSLDGTYCYIFKWERGIYNPFNGGDTTPISLYSDKVKVSHGRVYMTDFTYMPDDTASSNDTISISIYRSRGDVGAIDPSDYAWPVGVFYAATDTAISRAVFIDTLPDDSLDGDSVQILDEKIVGFDENADTSFMDRRYGAPGYVTRAGDADSNGVYWGWPTPEGVAGSQGVSYAVAFIDTLTSIESRLGGGFAIIRDPSDTIKSYTISLPRPPTTLGSVAINLYRAAIRTIAHVRSICGTAKWDVSTRTDGGITFTKTLVLSFCGDELTDLIAIYGTPTSVSILQTWTEGNTTFTGPRPVSDWHVLLTTDTVYLDQYKLVAQIADTSTTYADSLSYDSLYGHRPYQVNNVPPFMTSTFAYNGRLYGADGNNLYRSDAGDADSWGLFDFVEVDPGADLITAAWPGQFALAIAKQFSRYGVSEKEFVESEIVGRWGCIAPKSFALTPAGPIYLSASGVVLETDGQYLERTIVPGIISDKIPHILLKDILELKDARGGWLPREEQYWLNIGDTTWVWDWKATKRLGENVWTTSSVDFAGMTTYDPTANYENVAGRSMYFWRSGDARIYRFGSGNTYPEKDYNVDGTGYIRIVPSYMTGPLLWGNEASQIRAINVLVAFDGTTADSLETLLIKVYDQNGTLDYTGTYSKLYNRYLKRECTVTPEFYYQLMLTTYSTFTLNLESGTAIEMIEVYYVPDAEKIPFTY